MAWAFAWHPPLPGHRRSAPGPDPAWLAALQNLPPSRGRPGKICRFPEISPPHGELARQIQGGGHLRGKGKELLQTGLGVIQQAFLQIKMA